MQISTICIPDNSMLVDGVLRARENYVCDISYSTAFEVMVQNVLQEKEAERSPKCSMLKEFGAFRRHSCYPVP